ncbi:aromatic ring-hydroxylating dioxygenase subunit alpha [Sphingobium sp. MK2]|uniref:aromatic ring-hydroxylating dioxygenase subunit alpha n=1 Tax=Sphingobium sp. MK2 TaxID=3116540 RepID=UPI0032E3599A
MFPFKDDHFAPLNRWYIAAWSNELTTTPFERWILDEPVAMYRTEDGQCVAVDGRCPHHLFPLGKSKLNGNNIRCGYHGLEFAPDGSCVAAPFLDHIPSSCRIKSYAVAERWEWVWIWPGDPALADESLIPDHFDIKLTDPAYLAEPARHAEINARYQLINDNLLDLTHVEVLHASTIGEAGVGRVKEEVTSGDGWIKSDRYLPDTSVPPAFQLFLGDQMVDRRFGMKWQMPALHVGYDLFTQPASQGNGAHVGQLNVFHAVTPARKHACHYFVATSRDFGVEDKNASTMFRAAVSATLDEDMFAAEEVERHLQATSTPRELLFRSDATLVKGRRMLEELMASEKSLLEITR